MTENAFTTIKLLFFFTSLVMLLSGLKIRHHEIELFIQNIFKALKFNKTVTEKKMKTELKVNDIKVTVHHIIEK